MSIKMFRHLLDEDQFLSGRIGEHFFDRGREKTNYNSHFFLFSSTIFNSDWNFDKNAFFLFVPLNWIIPSEQAAKDSKLRRSRGCLLSQSVGYAMLERRKKTESLCKEAPDYVEIE